MSSINTVTSAGPGDGDHQVQQGKCGSAGIQEQNVGDQQVVSGDEDEGVGRSDFPPNFVFGVATAAYQVEGACKEGGRGACIWDAFTHTDGKICDGSNGDIAVDQYHRYKEDIDLISKLGFSAYRFSISWSRIFPDGFGTKINDEGVAYYNNLINALLEKGLLPFVTLYHWDLPQNLHQSMGGWLNRQIVELFTIYAEACFSNFGDRVKNWITINEALQTAVNGYCTGIFAPGRNEHPSTEPYIAAHHQILAHAASVSIYKKKYKDTQRGQIGFVVDCEWAEPFSDKTEDINAALRRIEFQLGWFLDPLLYGDYPEIMREKIGDQLPKFSQEDKELLHNAIDFIGLNHYTSRYIAHGLNDFEQNKYYKAQEIISFVELEGGKLIGERAASSWLYVVPWGIRKLINYIKLKYKEVPIYVTENGMDDEDDDTLPLHEILDDKKRVGYYKGYLSGVAQAIKDGADVRGYFAWSLLDNFEWAQGYTKRFGLVYVDYKDGLSRHPKSSALWFSRFLRANGAKRIKD